MAEANRGPLRWLGHGLAQVAVGIYVVIDSILSPLFRPLMRWLSSLHIVQSVEGGIASLPAYGILVLLAAPFGVEEFAKVYGLVLMGGGHFKIGLLIYIGAHVFAILVCERIFSAGKEKLLTIGWFATLFNWLKGYKDRLVAWFKSTDLYRRAHHLKARAADAIRALLGRTKSAFGR